MKAKRALFILGLTDMKGKKKMQNKIQTRSDCICLILK